MVYSSFRCALIALLLSVAQFPLAYYGQRVKGSVGIVTVHKCDMLVKAVERIVVEIAGVDTETQRTGSSNGPSIITATDVVIILPAEDFPRMKNNSSNCQKAWTHLSSQLFLFLSFQLCSDVLRHPNWMRPLGYGQALIFISCHEMETVTNFIIERMLI